MITVQLIYIHQPILFCHLNDNSPTYLHPATDSVTSIDLTMCSSSFFMDYTLRVEEDLHGSDHFPITFIILLKTDHQSCCFRQLIGNLLKTCVQRPFFRKILKVIGTFIDKLCEIANKTIPKSNLNPKKRQKPWFSETYKQAVIVISYNFKGFSKKYFIHRHHSLK